MNHFYERVTKVIGQIIHTEVYTEHPKCNAELYHLFRHYFIKKNLTLNPEHPTITPWSEIQLITKTWNLSHPALTFTIQDMWLYVVLLSHSYTQRPREKTEKIYVSHDKTRFIMCNHRDSRQLGDVWVLTHCCFDDVYTLDKRSKPDVPQFRFNEYMVLPTVAEVREIWPSLTMNDDDIESKVQDELGEELFPCDEESYERYMLEDSEKARDIIYSFVKDMGATVGYSELPSSEHREMIQKFNLLDKEIYDDSKK